MHASSIGAYPLCSFQEEHTLEPELGPREARDFHASTINDLQFCNGYSCSFLHCRSERHRSQCAAGCARSLWQKARRLVSYALVLTCFDQSNLDPFRRCQTSSFLLLNFVAGPAIDLARYGLACSDRIKPNEFLTCTVMYAYICKIFRKTRIHLSQLIKLYAREIRHKA